MSSLKAIRFNKETSDLSILNQLLLPETLAYEAVNNVQDAWTAIKLMKVIFQILMLQIYFITVGVAHAKGNHPILTLRKFLPTFTSH